MQWPQYDEIQQQYLTIGKTVLIIRVNNISLLFIAIKPKTRDHYHAHRLSYWLNLLPQLHTAGPSSAEEHHLLEVKEYL